MRIKDKELREALENAGLLYGQAPDGKLYARITDKHVFRIQRQVDLILEHLGLAYSEEPQLNHKGKDNE